MQIHTPTNSLVLHAPDLAAMQSKFKKSRPLNHAEFNLAVPYTIASVRTLWSEGIHAPSPVMRGYRYPGKYKPFDHQRHMAEFLTLNRKAINLSEMGTGKSAATLWAADALIETGRVKKVLILSPLSTLRRVWANDIFDVLMHRTCVVVHGTRDQRMAALDTDVDFYIMNHEGVMIDPVAQALARDPDIGLVVVDEASMFRNGTTKKYKALTKMLRADQRLWLLTGTPCPNQPTDAWALAKLINPENVPKFFGGFRRATMVQKSQFVWAPRPEAYTVAYEAMQPAVRFKKDECLDLPPVVTMDREAPLSVEQKRMFAQMRAEMKAEAGKTAITAVHAADRLNKLRQILCGSIKDPVEGGYIDLDFAPRGQVLLDVIDEASAKVIVIVPFKGAVYGLQKLLEEKGHSCAVLNGDVSPRKRDEILLRFKTEDDPRVLLCHPKVMSHGLNLTEADTTVFFAPIYSNDEFQQVLERFNRTGQTRKMTVVRMGSHALEWSIYGAVDDKKTSQDTILDLYKSVIA